MPTALHFKGDKKPKKRKRVVGTEDTENLSARALAITTQAEAEGDDSWVSADAPSDISGPIIVVLPTNTPSCLACDANGKIFTSELENIVEGDPATAEPHDVRQVFVANRVAGTENLSLKGHHGRYLSCDKYGVLSASATAISPEESFLVISVPDNPLAFSIQTAREKFISVNESSAKGSEARGDAESITFTTAFRIRMQARFKPRLRISKEEKAKEKISKKELEDIIGRRLEDDEVRRLKKARREGDFHEVALDIKVKFSHDKYAS